MSLTRLEYNLRNNKRGYRNLTKEELINDTRGSVRGEIKETIDCLESVNFVSSYKISSATKLLEALKVLADESRTDEYETNIEIVRSVIDDAHDEIEELRDEKQTSEY